MNRKGKNRRHRSPTKRHTTIGIYCNLCNLLFYKTHKIHIIRACFRAEEERKKWNSRWNCKRKFNFSGDFFWGLSSKRHQKLKRKREGKGRVGGAGNVAVTLNQTQSLCRYFFGHNLTSFISFHFVWVCLSNRRHVIEF